MIIYIFFDEIIQIIASFLLVMTSDIKFVHFHMRADNIFLLVYYHNK